MKRMQLIAAAATLALGGSFVSAGATSVDFKSDMSLKGLGAFTGTASYDNSTDKLTITLDNTSATKSVITGFAFDIAGDDKAKFERPLHSHWKDDRNHKGIVNAKPLGNYEAGAALGGKFSHGASKLGIAMGAEKTFVFDVTGTDASTLTASDFFAGPATKQLVANFAGFRHHKTDKAGGAMIASNITIPGGITIPITDPPLIIKTGGGGGDGVILPPTDKGGGATAVPLPPAAYSGLAMLGLLGAAMWRKRLPLART